MTATFDLTAPLLRGRANIQASAGTGKTYALTGLLVRYVAEAGLTVDQMLVVTFTRAAANELRERTREALRRAAAVLDGESAGPHEWMRVLCAGADDTERSERRRRLTAAIAHFDELTITTIHGFCQQALNQVGLRAGGHPDSVLIENTAPVVAEVCRDLIVSDLVDQPDLLRSASSSKKTIANPGSAERELMANVTAMMSNPAATLAPPMNVDHEQARRWRALSVSAHAEVERRLGVRRQIGYDALISGLQRALVHPAHGASVAAQLGQRFTVVLVDEFQDTDRLQWEVFERAFGHQTLVTVGDPKQAIYRFHGANVHAYLDAVQHAPPLVLDTNHRSDTTLLTGLAHVLRGATLGDDRIAFTPVRPRPGAPVSSLRRDDGTHPGTAITLRAVPDEESLHTSRANELSMPKVRSLVLADLVNRTIDLLDHCELTEPDGTVRRVAPGDIAVLVPTHAEADNVAEAYRRASIAAVRTRTGSVTHTPAAEQWRLLLTALAQPHSAGAVRAAALGWFLTTDLADLDASEPTLVRLQETAAVMADRMRITGVGAFYDEQKSAGCLLETVLSRPGGDRHITDLDHIAELLVDDTQGGSSDPGQVLRTLDAMITDGEERAEDAMRRIDSDALAVQVTTIHAAKGLEYPIVLLPFSFKQRAFLRTPCSYMSAGQRTIDVASGSMWDTGPGAAGDEATRHNQEARRNLATIDAEGDDLRLLYVALTRAKHRVEVWWASTRAANTSALARVLLDRDGADDVLNRRLHQTAKPRAAGFNTVNPPHHRVTPSEALAQIERLVAGSAGTIDLTVLPVAVTAQRWTPPESDAPGALAIASRGRRRTVADPVWKRWSFSRLSAAVESASVGADPDRDPTEQRDVDQGGTDEPADGGDEYIAADPVTRSPQLQLGVGPVSHLAEVAGGTRFGTFVHRVLEDLDFASASLDDDLAALVATHARRDALDLPAADVVAGLAAAVRTPLGPLFNARSLTSIGSSDRLNELTFDFAIGEPMTAGAIGEALLATLPRRDPMRPFATSLAGEFARFNVSGWMHGSVDAVVRVPHDGEHRFLVIDYKTNRLHRSGDADPVAAYHPRHLLPAMEHSRYPLQALLYSVALHRYLRWRLGSAYLPDRHLGGIAYLFLRGMAGPATPQVAGVPHGVFAWRPPAATIVEIDRLFGGAS